MVSISSRSSQKTFDVDWHGMIEVEERRAEERSRKAWSWRVCGESRTGRKTRSVESTVMVYSTRSSLVLVRFVAMRRLWTCLLDARGCLQVKLIIGRGCPIAWV